MTTPDVADPNADYGMPDGGFADYVVGVTDPTTDWTSGNPPGETNTGGPGGNQLIVDAAEMTRTARRCWVRFTAGASPALAVSNPDDAMWGNDSGVLPVVAHSTTGVWTVTFPATVTDKLNKSHSVNLRWAKASVEGATWRPAQAAVTSPNVVTVYGFDTSGSANDLTSSFTIFVEAG